MNVKRFVAMACLALLPGSLAFGQVSGIYVEYYSPSNPYDGWATVPRDPPLPPYPDRHKSEPGLASGSDITINNANVVPYRVFAVDYANTDIGNITFGSSQTTTQLMIGRGSTQVSSGQPLSVAGARHVGAINGLGVYRLRVQARVEGTIQGTVSAYEVVRLDAGAITGGVSHNPGADSAAPALGWISAGSINSNIRSWRGPIEMIQTTGNCTSAIQAHGDIRTIQIGGNFIGSIAALPGSIELINVTGNIGTPGSLASITTSGGTSTVWTSINDIRAAAIYANITTPNTSSNRGNVRQIVTTAPNGPFVGSLTTFAMEGTVLNDPTIDVKGNFDADLNVATIKRPVKIGGILPSNRTIRIGQDLKAEGWTIFSGSNGLQGQIIINAWNDTRPWTGTITANSITLGPGQSQPNQAPYYERLSSEIGGGAVGLAPFQLHSEDCDPPNGGTVVGGFPYDAVLLCHYGPITWGSGMPVTVEYQLPSWGDVWFDITEDFDVTPGPTDRDLVVWALKELDFDGILRYRIRPVRIGGAALRCAYVLDNPPVADYTYLLNSN